MPRAWSKKDERQYEHVRASELREGRSPALAEEIAARTVNKERREEGRTPTRRTSGTGNPNTPLEERSRDELYNLARARSVPGRGTMRKSELVRALEDNGDSLAQRLGPLTNAVLVGVPARGRLIWRPPPVSVAFGGR